MKDDDDSDVKISEALLKEAAAPAPPKQNLKQQLKARMREEAPEIDPGALEDERSKAAAAAAAAPKPKPAAPISSIAGVKPGKREWEDKPEVHVPSFLERLFSWRPRIWLPKKRHVFLAALVACGWGYQKFTEQPVLVLSAPDCADRAGGISGRVFYQNVPLAEKMLEMKDAGPILCTSSWVCWARWKPWLGLHLRKAGVFPSSDMGVAYMEAELPLVFFHNEKEKKIRARAMQLAEGKSLTFGTQECAFSVEASQSGLLFQKSGDLLAAYQAYREQNAQEAPATAAAPEQLKGPKKKDKNVELFDRFRDWTSTGVF